MQSPLVGVDASASKRGEDSQARVCAMTALRCLWRGEVPLAQAFWNWAVIGALIVNGATTLAFLILIMVERPFAALIAGYAISVPYNILVAVGVWRAAGRYS